jgi:uncharacterized repeat protein (TIGR01451 family)
LDGGGGGPLYLRVNVSNSSGGTINLQATATQDTSTTTTNNGTLAIGASGRLAMSGGGVFTQGSTGVLSDSIDAVQTTNSQITGGTVNLNGALQVNTSGTPVVASSWPIVNSTARTGTFLTLSFGAFDYDSNYLAGGVTLVAGVPFTLTPQLFAATDGIGTGTVTLATLSDPDRLGGAAYIAAVDWGDTTQTAATVTLGGAGSATVTGQHTYLAAGPVTVSITVADNDGTTITTNELIAVAPAPPSASLSTLAAAPTSVTSDGVSFSTVTVTLNNILGQPIAGKAISLAPDAGTHSSINAVNAVTDGNGHAVFQAADGTAETVTYTATDTTDGVVVTQTATVIFIPGLPSGTASTAVAAPTQVTADATSFSTITITLTDALGNPIAGKTIGLTGSAGGHSSISAIQGVTDANGHAVFQAKDATAETVAYTATDTTDGITIAQQPQVTFQSTGGQDLGIILGRRGGFVHGQQSSFFVTVTNTGTVATAGPTTVTDTLPVGLTYVRVGEPGLLCTVLGQTVTCTHGASIASGARFTFTIMVSVEAGARTRLSNSATVTPADSTPADNSSTVNLTVG